MLIRRRGTMFSPVFIISSGGAAAALAADTAPMALRAKNAIRASQKKQNTVQMA